MPSDLNERADYLQHVIQITPKSWGWDGRLVGIPRAVAACFRITPDDHGLPCKCRADYLHKQGTGREGSQASGATVAVDPLLSTSLGLLGHS